MKKIEKSIFGKSIVRFIIVGGCSTGMDFIIYMLLSLKVSITFSKSISMICASFFSYFLNKSFTFKNKDKTNIGRLIKFYIVFVANFGVNISVNFFVYGVTGCKFIAFIFATLCGMTVNYLGQRYIVFKMKG